VERLKRCFRCIELLASMGAPTAVWQREAGDAFGCIEALLAPTGRLAERWPGARAGQPSRRVVDYGDGRAAAICDQELSPPESLTPADRAMLRVDERRLRKLLAECFELRISRDDVPVLPGVMRIGDWAPKPAARFPVLLAVASTPGHLAELVVRVLDGYSKPEIVLTPTRAMWSERSDALADPKRITMVALEEVMNLSDGQLRTSSDWDQVLGVFMQNAGLTLPDSFSNTRKKMRVAKTGATAAKLKTELKDWYRPARAHLLESGELLPAPELQQLAEACGVHASTAGRWLNGDYRERDMELRLLWQNITDPEFVKPYRD